MKIGVFDSGVGGISVANAIQRAFPELTIVYKDDHEHVPYGIRPPEQILGFIEPIFQELITAGCQLIVVACNTVSTTLLPLLRQRFPVPFIGVEPMVKPAARLTKSGVIAVCATPTTLASERYHWLKQTYAATLRILEPDCSDWSYMIEHKQVDEQQIAKRIGAVINERADVIVLGCTHYHWIETLIKDIAAHKATVLQPEQAIVQQLERELARLA